MFDLILVCLLLLFAALLLFWRGHRLRVLLCGAGVFWLLGSWLAGPLVSLAQAGYNTPVEPRFTPRMAFILLGAGTGFDEERRLVPKGDSIARMEAAVRLYKRCRQTENVCQVIVSGGDAQHHGSAEADVYAPYLLKAGIAAPDLVLEDKSMNTIENARNVDQLLRRDRYDGMVLITSSLHMRRAMLSFGAFDLHPQPFVANVREPHSWKVPHPEGWTDSNNALHEMLGVVRLRVWHWLGVY